MRSTCLLAFDAEARILKASWFHPDYAGGIGSYPWEHVAAADQAVVRSCVWECLHERKSCCCEASWGNAGRWRVIFIPFDIGQAAMFAVAWEVPEPITRLNERQRAVCQLLSRGLDVAAIAIMLGVSERTVRDARHSAAEIAGVAVHELGAWCGEMRRFLEPL